MKIQLHYSGKWLHWNGPAGDVGKYHASSGLFGTDDKKEPRTRMFRVGTQVYVFNLDYRCTWYEKMKNHGPIPSGTYQVATREKGYASYNASICGLRESYGIQLIPRGGSPDENPHDGVAGSCEQYWVNWGFNRVALQPFRDMVAPHRNGFYIHDSSKGFTHGCIEVDQKFFSDRLLPTVRKHPKIDIRLIVKYQDGFRTFGNTLAVPDKTGPIESEQAECLIAFHELTDRLKKNAPNTDEKPFVSTYRRPTGVRLDPPPQSRLQAYDVSLNLIWGRNDVSREPDKLAKINSWWGNFR